MQLAVLPRVFDKQIFIHSHNKKLIYLFSASLSSAGSPFTLHLSYFAKIISQHCCLSFPVTFFLSLEQLRISKIREKIA